MKNRFHVFSRMFTKLIGAKPANVNVFLFLLFALLTVPSAWATTYYENVTTNGQTVRFPGRDTLKVYVSSGVTSFTIPEIKIDGCASCTGTMYIEAPSGYGLVITGKLIVSAGTRMVAYDDYQNNPGIYLETCKMYDWTESYGSSHENVEWHTTNNNAEILIVNTYGSGNVLSDVNLTVTVKKLYDVSSNLISVYRPNYSGSFTGLAHGTDMTEGGWVSLFTSDTDDVTTSLKVRRKDNNNLVPTSRNGNTLRFQMPASDVRIEGTEKDINHLDHIDMLCILTSDRLSNPKSSPIATSFSLISLSFFTNSS